MRKYHIILIGLLAGCWNSVGMAAVTFNNEVPDCVGLGYDMGLSACQAQMKSLLSATEYAKFHPLHCPYNYNQVRCWRSNCAGYNITAPDANFTAEECLAGIENGNVIKYRRYAGCTGKDGVNYRYDNGDCIDRCDVNKYPFDMPPGTLAGEVESCYDDSMHYGYSGCNEGFGELKNGSYVPKNGRCDMLICDVNTYPYFEKPDESRGKLEVCAGGTNKYYKYNQASCEANGYTYKNGVCRKKFEVTANSFPGITYGDILAYNGTEIATVIHIPDGTDNRYLAVGLGHYSGKWGRNIGTTDTFPVNDLNGKCHTKLYYDDYVNNNQSHYIVRSVYEYYPAVCGKTNSYCGAGKWYVPAVGEVSYVVEVDKKYLSRVLGVWVSTNVWQSYASTPAKSNTWFYWTTYWAGQGDCDWCPTLMFIEFGPNKLACS